MDLIRQCVERYSKEVELFAEVARVAAMRLEASLAEAGVRAIVTHRAKNPVRLEEKLRKRAPDKDYRSVEDMYEDVVDLAGVRVALYFPGDRDLVGSIIKRNFVEVEPERAFPAARQPSEVKKFSGYAATHYRVRLPGDPDELPGCRTCPTIEIQVASVLMHGWAEVEHDLAYKPSHGELSARELALLDQLNGLVIACEIALEQLQAAGQERVGELHRPFRSHYDLAAHLVQLAEDEHHLHAVPEEGLGRVDLLFELLARRGLGTPHGIAPYLEQLHRDLGRRPLAEQVINAILAQDGTGEEFLALVSEQDAPAPITGRAPTRPS